jgi:hypothetical protein
LQIESCVFSPALGFREVRQFKVGDPVLRVERERAAKFDGRSCDFVFRKKREAAFGVVCRTIFW